MAQHAIFIVGMGELGSVFARAFLKMGHPVYPVIRGMSMNEVAAHAPAAELCLIAVGETDLAPILSALPGTWRSSVVLVQNELLPYQWRKEVDRPTVTVVWFEKKAGQEIKVVLPTILHGPKAPLVGRALGTLQIPHQAVETEEQLEIELVKKNLYILTTNIAGLETGGTVGALWQEHNVLARQVADEVIDIQEHLVGRKLPRAELFMSFEQAALRDPEHNCTGRTAPARMGRALEQARLAALKVPTLQRIAARHS